MKWMMALAIATAPTALAAQDKAPWSAPATAAVVAEELTFVSGGVTLSGTLYRPAGRRNLPAMVVLHGAGVPLRSAPLFRHLYPELAIAEIHSEMTSCARSRLLPFPIIASDDSCIVPFGEIWSKVAREQTETPESGDRGGTTRSEVRDPLNPATSDLHLTSSFIAG